MHQRLTRVRLEHHPHRKIVQLVFGHPVQTQQSKRDEAIHFFSPQSLFGILWQRWDPSGQKLRVLGILSASLGANGERLPNVSPAAHVHILIPQFGHAGQEGPVDVFLDWIVQMTTAGTDPTTLDAKLYCAMYERLLFNKLILTTWRVCDQRSRQLANQAKQSILPIALGKTRLHHQS